jgi:hypothetical protein
LRVRTTNGNPAWHPRPYVRSAYPRELSRQCGNFSQPLKPISMQNTNIGDM